MTRSKSFLFPLIGSAVVGVVPAMLAAGFAPGPWTILAAAGAAIAATGLLVNGVGRAHELAKIEDRQGRLQSAASVAEARVAALEAKLREAAALDELTGTLNRRAFLTRFGEVTDRDARLHKPMAFLLIDVDGFQRINAEAGRTVGDQALRRVGQAIQASTRGTDFVGRIGGDEFAVVLGECVDPRPAVDRIVVALHGESTGGDKPLPIGVSIGAVTIPEPQRGIELTQLFRTAEEALGSVRATGGGRCGRREYPLENPRPVGVS